MLLYVTCMLAVAAAAPTYDQRQDGEFNVQADVQNIVFLFLSPEKTSSSVLNFFSKTAKRPQKHEEPQAQDRSDGPVMEAFVEPNEPYRVEIGSEGDSYLEADGRDVEVVIAGRRRLDADPQEKDEYKLIGATEQCGPDRVRDPVTLTCRSPAKIAPEAAEAETAVPEVEVDIPALS